MATTAPTINPVKQLARRREGGPGLVGARELGVLIPLIGLIAIFYVDNANFGSSANAAAILQAVAYVGIIAIGQGILMLAGEIDISVGSVAGLGGVLWAWLMARQGVDPIPATLIVLAAGAAIGAFNGVVTVKIGVPALVTTLGMFFIARGLAYVVTNGVSVYGMPHSVEQFGSGEWLGLAWSVYGLFALVVVTDVIMRHTRLGSRILATGGNESAARSVGINTDRVKIGSFMVTSLLSVIAGMIVVAQLRSGDPTIGTGLELQAIAAVVIGGVSLLGGVGRVLGIFLGVCLMQVIASGMVFMQVDTNYQNVVIGLLLIGSVALDVVQRRRGGRVQRA
jgi:ribose transport system permease protein